MDFAKAESKRLKTKVYPALTVYGDDALVRTLEAYLAKYAQGDGWLGPLGDEGPARAALAHEKRGQRFPGNRGPSRSRHPSMPLDEEDAQRLQRHALEALAEVRDWVWAHHQLPEGAAVTREQAEQYAAYIEWFSRLEAAIQMLGEPEKV